MISFLFMLQEEFSMNSYKAVFMFQEEFSINYYIKLILT